MGQVYDTMVEFFEKSDWRVLPLSDNIVRVDFTGNNGTFLCYAQELIDQEGFIFYSTSPIKVPENKRLEVSKFITLANYGLILGNFEMDWQDGEVRYKTSMYTNGQPFTCEIMEPLVFGNVVTLDKYFPGLMSIIYGNLTPEEAISLVEAKTAGELS